MFVHALAWLRFFLVCNNRCGLFEDAGSILCFTIIAILAPVPVREPPLDFDT